MYYDTRPVIFTKYDSLGKKYFNYGHISDNTPNPINTVSGTSFSTSVYWNYGWVPKGYKVCAQDMIVNVDGTPQITFTIGQISVLITGSTLTLTLNTSFFNSKQVFTYNMTENIFDGEEFSFFVGYEDIEYVADNQYRLFYYIKINDTYYRAIGTTARSGYENIFAFSKSDYPCINTTKVTGSTINFSVTPKNVSFKINTLIVLGSSLFGDETVLPDDIKDEDLDISDFYDQQIVLLHSHVNTSTHNHTRRATGTSGIDRNFDGTIKGSSLAPQRVISYSKNNTTSKDEPFYLVSSLKTVKTTPPYKIQLGGNDFVISYYGYFNTSTDSDAIHKIPFKVYFGEFVGSKIGDSEGKYLPEGSTTKVEAASTLKMNVMLDKDNKRLQANIYSELGTRNVSETNLKWHPLFSDRFQITLYYDHGMKQLRIYSSLISKNNIAIDKLDNTRYLLHTENNVLFSELTNAFFQFGPDPSELIDVTYSKGTNTALDKYTVSLTDMVAVGFSNLIVCGKIYYCTSSMISSQISGIYRLRTGSTYDLWIIGNDTERKSETNGLATNIETYSTQLGITNLGGEVLNNLWCTHYTLKPVEYGNFTITSSYSTVEDKNPYRYECHVDLPISVVVVPTITISAQGSSNSSLQDIGSASRPKFSIKSEDDFNLIVTTNLDVMPTLVNTSTLDIRNGTRISAKKYSFLVKPFEIGTFNFTVKYDATDINDAKSIAISVQVLANKKDTTISCQNSNGTALSNMTLTSSTSDTFVVMSNRNRPPDVEVSQRRALSVVYKTTTAVSGTENYKHTYEIHGQFPGQNVMVLCTYEDDGIYAGNSTSFMVTVESVPLEPWVDPDTASVVILQKDSDGNWIHSLSMNSAGTTISKTDVKVPTALKAALKTFTNNLKT